MHHLQEDAVSTRTIDHHGPGQQGAPGDLIVTPRIIYRVTAVRPVESRQWPERWRYTCEKVRDRTVDERRTSSCAARPDLGGRIITTGTYGPGERPGQPHHQRCGLPDCEGCV